MLRGRSFKLKNVIAMADSKTVFVEACVMSTIRLYDDEPFFNEGTKGFMLKAPF